MPIEGQPAGRVPAPPALALVQDFVNTEIVEWHEDELPTPDALAAWVRGRGFAVAAVAGAEHSRAVAVRDGLRALLLANNGYPLDQDAVTQLDAVSAQLRLEVTVDAGGAVTLRPGGSGVDAFLGRVLADVALAQAAGEWPRMKACRMHHCWWCFYDSSRNRSGRWCSATICGSRNNARAYRSRRRASGRPPA